MSESKESHTILVVEDNTANLLLTEEILKLGGYDVVSASSAEQAQLLIVRQLPDLVLLDVRLPGTDGLTLLHKLRSSPLTEALPVIALTAQAMPDDVTAGLAAGFDDYVVKPIRAVQLLEAVRGALSQGERDPAEPHSRPPM